MTLQELILIASGLTSTTYGHGEMMCGDVGKPLPCSFGAITASGEIFDPDTPSAAIAAPFELQLKPTYVRLKVPGGKCRSIRVTDKMHPRWIGVRGFDISPAGVKLLTGKSEAPPTWSSKIEVCEVKK